MSSLTTLRHQQCLRDYSTSTLYLFSFLSLVLLEIVFSSAKVGAAPIDQKVIRSTALIGIYDEMGQLMGRASGVIVSKEGTIVTNRHVVEDENGDLVGSLIVIPTNSNEEPDWSCAWTPSHVLRHSERDIAVLITSDSTAIPCGISHLEISTLIPETGTNIQILGYPAIGVGSLSITLTNGQIAGRISAGGKISELKTDAKIIQGVSGGPVLEGNGNLIGIATAYVGSSSEYIGFVTPTFYALELIKGQGYISQPHAPPNSVDQKQTEPPPIEPSTDPNDYYFGSADLKMIYSDVTEMGCSYLANLGPVSEEYQQTGLLGWRHACERSRALILLKGREIMTGYPDGSFRPMNKINRAEFSKIVVKAFHETPDPDRYRNCFPDVTTQWFAPFVCFAKEKGWLAGYPDGQFKPEQPVNNTEALKILLAPNYDVSRHQKSNYKSINSKEWYADFIKAALDLNIVDVDEWSGLSFSPGGEINRDTISVILYKFYLVKSNNLRTYKFFRRLGDTGQ